MRIRAQEVLEGFLRKPFSKSFLKPPGLSSRGFPAGAFQPGGFFGPGAFDISGRIFAAELTEKANRFKIYEKVYTKGGEACRNRSKNG